jgi:hypothetical protein
VILGFVHNSLEGNLEHYLRVVLGIGRSNRDLNAQIKFLAEEHNMESATEGETSEATDELQELQDENDNPSEIPPGDVDMLDDERSTTPTHFSILLSDLLDSDSDPDDPDYQPGGAYEAVFELTADQLARVRACIQEVLLPTWVERPPGDLGEARHGKLKAHELLVLFTDILPLILPELWWKGSQQDMGLLENFCFLVASTNIIASYSISATDPDDYMNYYIQFRSTLHALFPAISSRPNHHYAMHNGHLLQFWGPLSILSEFPGEQANGMFQRTKTNHRFSEYHWIKCKVY